MQRWRLFLPTTAVVLTLALPTAAQPPLPLSPETRGYVERRLDAAEREEKALTRRVASARKRAVWSDVVRMMRVEDEVVVLSWALGQVQDELRELRLLDLRRRGKPIGGDPRANLRHYSEQAVGLIASRDYYLKKRDETEAAMRALAASPRRRPGDVEMIQWAVEAYPALMAAIANRQVTDDHLLAALGAPGAATLDAAQRRAEAEREEAMRLRAAREAYEGQQAVEQLLGAAASFVGVFLEAVTEMSNHDLKDLGDGGAQARASRAFSPVGLHHGEMLGRILMGESVPRDMRVRLAFDAYVVKFSGMCEKFLPADQVQIDEIPVHTVITTNRNYWGTTVSTETTRGAANPTGVFAAPEFARAHVRVTGTDMLNALGLLASGPSAAFRTSTEIRADIRRVIARHDCDGPVVQQLSRNLLRLVQ